MQREDDSLIREMVDTIVREANPDTVILFGSRARGDARPDSDVDLLIVEPEPFSPQRSRRQETARLYLALRKLAIAKDLLLYSRDEVERLKDSAHHIVGRAQREGRVLHAQPDLAQDLLLMARRDFDALRGMLDNPLFADEIFGFHAQQAIEKSLKAWLAARSLSFPLTQVRVECLGRGLAAAWRKKG